MKQQQFEQSANSAAIRDAILQSARECVFEADALTLYRSLSPAGQAELTARIEMLVARHENQGGVHHASR
jgi:hypothetical protein